jgi:type II secretory ATPase GspE/PulE/Tfp pilus assembly ATPase PilB-like protein
LPTPNGEAIVLRILNREEILIRIQDLGFDKNQLETMNRLIISPHGMILTTGPSGSGKTTLLYSTLNELNKPDNNIIALEDPIEFQMPTIRQVQISEGSSLDFARAMRSVLRQDPDIIMVGEIRDPETAQMAFQAALTGILVFSTFHTLDVPGLVARLVEMGMPRSVIAQAIEGVVSSRLLRKICDSCKKPYQLSDYEKMILGDKSKGKKFQKGDGCKNCLNSGYFGRTGIFEVVHFDNEIRSSIISKEPYAYLHKLLKEKGIKTLRESAIDKVFQGITTVEEVARVTGVPYKG